ncbi:MAG: hypothetical protein COC05_02695 [Gammaproteobacteria bacterium]|nr:hypothetical protein [bacterium AH-315-E07]PCH60923.1 MAG: hypothetical protein COC05_02695 [Gammaproteobacteria bacterium]
MTRKTDTTTLKKTGKTVKKTAKKSIAKADDPGAVVKKELEKTQSQLHELQDDNVQLKEKLSQLEERINTEISHRSADDSHSWDEKVAHGLCRIARAWSDYGPVIIIGLFVLMLIAWIGPWDGLFKLCFTLLMVWVFVASLGVAKSNIKNRFNEALYQIRRKG